MSLTESVDLVLYAFGRACSGGIFVQKAPATTIGTLAQALRELVKRNNEIKIIGMAKSCTSHLCLARKWCVAKIWEATIVSRMTRVTAIATSISSMERLKISRTEDYTSHNARRLDVGQTKEVLMKVSIVREAMNP